MRPVRQDRVRKILRETPEGLTANQIAEALGMHVSNARTALRAMPDVYVDRWKYGKRGQYEKVWVAVHVPADCPHPRDKQFKGGHGLPPKTIWQKIKSWGISPTTKE